MWSVVSLLLTGVIIVADDGFPGPHKEHVDRHKHGSIQIDDWMTMTIYLQFLDWQVELYYIE